MSMTSGPGVPGMPGMPNLPGAQTGPIRTSGLAIAGFVCAFFCSLLGFVLSILGYNECKRSNGAIGGAGLAIAGMVISGVMFIGGILVAVAIPAFMDYTKKARKPEAMIQLNKIMKNAKVFYITNDRFPVFDQAVTPPETCCTASGKCQPKPGEWNTDAWNALDFQLDEPHLFRYGYKSDGTKLDAVAVGDLDCDGIEITYRLHVTAVQGTPSGTIEEPPPNSD